MKPLLPGADICEYRNMLNPLPLRALENTPVEDTMPITPGRPNSLMVTNQPVSYLPPKEELVSVKYVPMYEPKEDLVCHKRKYGSKGEQICCETMEKIYGVPFRSQWPIWLRNPETGGSLEIDCYNEDLKIGVEYNGIQHYVYPNHFHKTKEEFIAQCRRDQYKLETCDRNGVYLITVPYNVPHEKIEEYIRYYLPEAVNKREICDL